ncbi:hypothetical protein BC834DRAFT_875950 [Gloeopeniophorella convolvens]|nr:hypothetical protein BC834DRAFT_875950 [Gloeopeniophorella convolvens]
MPTISASSHPPSPSIERRKGGGGHGSSGGSHAGSGRGSSGGHNAPSDSGAPNGKSGGQSVPVEGLPSGKKGATLGGGGDKHTKVILKGEPFAGREVGGGTRPEVFGNSVYGSGYPGVPATGSVSGRSFPFFFWPVVYGGTTGASNHNYSDAENEYGTPSNTTRPGGQLVAAVFKSKSTGSNFRLVADNSSVTALLGILSTNCSSSLDAVVSSSTTVGNGSTPSPEQAVQYFRASSAVLTLDGYNNSAALSAGGAAPPSPLPNGTDTQLLGCLNSTIGGAVPLVNKGMDTGPPSLAVLLAGTLLVFVWTRLMRAVC